MKNINNQLDKAVELRQKAEKRIAQAPWDPESLSPGDTQVLMHDLRVHQIELEMQNETLLAGQMELEASRDRYQDLYDLAPVGYCTLSEKGLILEANLTAATLLGIARSRLIKQPISRFILKADQDIFYLHRKQLFETEKKQECELRMVRPDGAIFWAHLDGTAVQAPLSNSGQVGEGSPICKVMFHDISERKQAVETLLESEIKFRQTFDIAPVGIVMVGLDRRFISCNPSFAQALGYGTEELVGNLIEDVTWPEDSHIGMAEMMAIMKGEINQSQVYKRYLRKDGRVIWGEVTISLIRNSKAHPQYFIAIIQDVTERKQAEEKLIASENNFRQITENIKEVFWISEMDWSQIYYISPSFNDIWGEEVEKLYEQPFLWIDSIIEEDKEKVRSCIPETIAKDIKEIIFPDYRIKKSDGSIIWISSRAFPVFDSEGNPYRIAGIAQDITERKLAEEALLIKQMMLARTEAISHIGSWSWNIATDKVTWSDELFSIFQRDPREGAPSFSEQPALYYPEDMARLRQAVEGAVTDRTSYELELRAIRKDGETRVCVARGIPEMELGGRVVSLFGSLQDITERKQVEQNVEQLWNQNQLILNSAGEGILGLGLDGRHTFVNPEAIRMLGYGVDELIGKESHSLWHHTRLDGSPHKEKDCMIYNSLQDGVMRRVSNEVFWRMDGTSFPVEYACNPIYEKGQVIGIVVTFQDITIRKQAEEELFRSREQYMLAVRGTNDGIWDWNLRTNELFLSDRWKDQLGYANHELVNSFDTFENLFHPEDKPTAMDYVRRYIEGDVKVYSQEFRMLHKDGSYRWILARGEAIRDKNGKAHRMAGSHTDITESKLATQEIQLREERYRGLVETQNNLIARTDLNNILIFANDAYCVFNGKSRGELIGRKYSSNILPEDQKIAAEAHLGLLKPPHHYQIEVQHQLSSGIRWVRWEGSVVENKDGKIIEYQGVGTDITEQKQNQIELQNSLEKVQKAIKGIIHAFATTVETRDPYTAGHQTRVADLAEAIAIEMHLPEDQIEGIHMAGLIHDLGKIQVPAEILSKPGKISELEFELIQTHPQVGYDLLKDIEFPWPIAQIVLQHHEREDGSGYPKKLKGDKILIEAKIIGIADVIEAMSSHRPYRPALGMGAALDEIVKHKGTLYDTDIVASYLKVIKKGYQFSK